MQIIPAVLGIDNKLWYYSGVVEIQNALFGIVPLSKWRTLEGGAIRLDGEGITESILLHKRRIIESIEFVGGNVLVRSLVLDNKTSVYKPQALTFTQDEFSDLNKYVRVGLVSKKLRAA